MADELVCLLPKPPASESLPPSALEVSVPAALVGRAPTPSRFSLLIHMATFSMLGVLIRKEVDVALGSSGVELLSPTTALFVDLGPNVLGSFVLGVTGVAMKELLANAHSPLQLGLSTAFCGSITTYSSWNHQMVALFLRGSAAHAVLACIIGVSLPYSALQAGVYVGNLLLAAARSRGIGNATAQGWIIAWDLLSFAAGVVCVSVLVWQAASHRPFPLWLATCMGPLGTAVRYKLAPLSRLKCKPSSRCAGLNGLPWGTLTANLFACVIYELVIYARAHTPSNREWLLEAVCLGFLGCLSTISTFVSELRALSIAATASPLHLVVLYLTISLTLSVGLSALVSHFTLG